MSRGTLQYGLDRFSDRRAGHLDRPSTQIMSRDTARGVTMHNKKEYSKQYHKDHQQNILERHRKYHEEHKHDTAYRKGRREAALRYYRKNRDKCITANRQWHRNLITQVIEHYGGKCVCCGESELLFLTLDHIDGQGAKHRKQFGGRYSARKVYQWVIAQNYPQTLQVLCFNCNCGKARNNNVCPHNS